MDVFRFVNPTNAVLMQQGAIINGITSKTWVERYAEAGEFTFVAPIGSDIRMKLPIGSFVSHINSREIMVVENHEINEESGQAAEIIVTGRGFETLFEQRIVGTNKAFPVSNGVEDYTLPAGLIWNQIRDMIQRHIYGVYLVDGNNAIPYTEVATNVTGTGTSVIRTVKQQDLYSAVIELIDEAQLGIKVFRPGPWITPITPGNTVVLIHKGTDRRKTVAFSHDSGEIETADYLWTNRKDKNAAFIAGRWVETTVVGTQTQYHRRWMIVDASDIDQKYTAAPTGATLTALVAKMQQRGRQALAKQKNIAITKADVIKQSLRALYRTDYDLGDLVSISGNYGEDAVRRVTEYVEVEDSSGRSGYPTLSEP